MTTFSSRQMLIFDDTPADLKQKTKKIGAFALVLAIHALLLLLLLSGLGRRLISVVPVAVKVSILPPASPHEDNRQQAPPAQAKLAPKSVAPPQPHIVIEVPPVPTAPPAPPPAAPEVAPVAAGPATGAEGVIGNAAGAGSGGAGNGDQLRTFSSGVEYARKPVLEYPRSSRRSGEEGVTIMRVLVSETGQPVKASVQKSSGYERLDEAAHDAVMSALFKPFTENGKAIAANVLVPIRFKLND